MKIAIYICLLIILSLNLLAKQDTIKTAVIDTAVATQGEKAQDIAKHDTVYVAVKEMPADVSVYVNIATTLLTLLALWFSIRYSKKALEASQKAIDTSQKANEISDATLKEMERQRLAADKPELLLTSDIFFIRNDKVGVKFGLVNNTSISEKEIILNDLHEEISYDEINNKLTFIKPEEDIVNKKPYLYLHNLGGTVKNIEIIFSYDLSLIASDFIPVLKVKNGISKFTFTYIKGRQTIENVYTMLICNKEYFGGFQDYLLPTTNNNIQYKLVLFPYPYELFMKICLRFGKDVHGIIRAFKNTILEMHIKYKDIHDIEYIDKFKIRPRYIKQSKGNKNYEIKFIYLIEKND